MAPPPLSPHERRLGTFALATAALYAATGLFFAVLPRLSLRIAAGGEPISFGPGARMWHALSISMMAMLAVCSYFAGRAPRENRRFLVPVIVSKACSTLMAVGGLLTWHAAHAEAWAGRRTLWAAISTDLPLLLVTAWLYWKAAPGVSMAAQTPQQPESAGTPKPIQLGIAKPAVTKAE